MSEIWVISDTHFNHANILNFENKFGEPLRPGFDNISHMNEYIIEKWNSRVKPEDKVYHLGDVFMGDKENFPKLWARLNGAKRLVVGNHDDIKFLAAGGFFKKIVMWRKMTEFNVLLTHVPVHPSTLMEKRFEGKPIMNVHGHIHQNQSPPGRYKCVCVEHTDYTPVNMETLKAIATK
jgi:calcineurin-like phosphoesterase family protein